MTTCISCETTPVREIDWDATDALRSIVTAGSVDLRALRDPQVELRDLAP